MLPWEGLLEGRRLQLCWQPTQACIKRCSLHSLVPALLLGLKALIPPGSHSRGSLAPLTPSLILWILHVAYKLHLLQILQQLWRHRTWWQADQHLLCRVKVRQELRLQGPQVLLKARDWRTTADSATQ